MASSRTPAPVLPALSNPQRTAEARAAFTAHLASIGSTHISALEHRASDIRSNATAIAKQEEQVEKQTRKLEEESKKYRKVADEAAGGLKELGDIQNWAEVLERDLLVLETALGMGEGEEGWVTEDEEEGVDGGGVGDGKVKGRGEDEGAKEAAVAA